MLNLSKPSTGMVMLISCIICSIISSLSELCPSDVKGTCMNVASVLNCILCLIVFMHLFGMFKK